MAQKPYMVWSLGPKAVKIRVLFREPCVMDPLFKEPPKIPARVPAKRRSLGLDTPIPEP